MSDAGTGQTHLLPGEYIDKTAASGGYEGGRSDSDINLKYVKGEIRIVTEQARYPINSIANIVEDRSYRISPEYQRRHRWGVERQSRLIESLIMNVPVPPIFLYEYDYSKYEVMDGLQRLTAIHDFYRNEYALEGLEEWPELNGRCYDKLPAKVKEGIDRRYLSSVILLKETAQNEEDALRLKQLVFERINSGGVHLSPQESRNALFDGKMNQLAIALSRNASLCHLWEIPEPEPSELRDGKPSAERAENDEFRKMTDVELVLRFFAYRQKHRLHRSGEPLASYLDYYLRKANFFPQESLDALGKLFVDTIEFAESLLGPRCFYLYRKRLRAGRTNWAWLERPTITAYDPLMFVLSGMLPKRERLLSQATQIQTDIKRLYRENYEDVRGAECESSALQKREQHYRSFLSEYY